MAFEDGASVKVDELQTLALPLETYYMARRVMCKAQYPVLPYEGGLWWQHALEAAYADTRLKAGLICPHRGADLSTFQPDKNGCVTCPLHGLQWNVETGELVPVPDRESAPVTFGRCNECKSPVWWKGHRATCSWRNHAEATL